MSAKDFLILHGEKVAIGVTGLVCGLVVVNTLYNDGIRPSGQGATAKDITADIAAVSDYRSRARPPILKPVPEYAQRMKVDFERAIPSRPLMAWTTVHPDAGPVSGGPTFLYVYELLTPKVELVDAIGSLQVIIAVPDAVRGGERLSDLPAVEWTRNDDGRVVNTAGVIGAILEQRTGKDPKAAWKPVDGGKLIPVEDFGKPVVIEGTTDFETYAFRARIIGKATGYVAGVEGTGSVLVADGRILPAETTPDEAWWNTVAREIFAAKGAAEGPIAKRLLAPQPPPAGVTLAEGERAYQGSLAEPVAIVASSAIRFQLDKLSPDPQKPDGSVATILLTKLLRGDGQEKWLKMQKFTLRPGDVLGGERQEDNPLNPEVRKETFDLTTPFKLEKIEKEVERILYYEIKEVTRQDGKGRFLDVKTKTVMTDVATFTNTRTGEVVRLVKLGRLIRPGDPKARIYPDLTAAEEDKLFEADPGAFKQQPLKPEPPIKHAPGTGPLEDLRKKGDRLATTDTDYFEMPDGRLYYWEPLNKQTYMLTKPGATYKAPEAVVAPVPAPEPVAPKQPGGRAKPPEGLPPGGLPPDEGAMPPGFTPPPGLPPGGMPPPKR